MSQANSNERAYNLRVTPQLVVDDVDCNGKEYIFANVDVRLNGRLCHRTLMVKGKAMAELADVLVEGEPISVRCLIKKVVNDNGSTGGEYLSAIGSARKAA